VAETITITLPFPDPLIHSHNKGHWRKKTAAIRAARALAQAEAIRLGWGGRGLTRARVDYHVFYPDKRCRDLKNTTGSGCKPYMDGLVDAGVVVGDHWQVVGQSLDTASLDRNNPRVVLTLTENTPQEPTHAD
jgi:hypothetical protein